MQISRSQLGMSAVSRRFSHRLVPLGQVRDLVRSLTGADLDQRAAGGFSLLDTVLRQALRELARLLTHLARRLDLGCRQPRRQLLDERVEAGAILGSET